MPLAELLEQLGLDKELVERDRNISRDLGRVYRQQIYNTEDEQQRFLYQIAAGTEFRKSGAHSLLLSDWKAANESFRQAAECYCSAGNPYGLLMYVCAGESPLYVNSMSREYSLAGRMSTRVQGAFLLLATSLADQNEEQRSHQRSELAGATHSAVGVLGLPVGAYLDLVKAIETSRMDRPDFASEAPFFERRPRDKSITRLGRALVPFLLAHSNAMARAMENRYHWRRLAMPFHPVEPDVLAVALLAEQAARLNRERLVEDLIERVPLFPDSAAVMRTAVQERLDESSPEPVA